MVLVLEFCGDRNWQKVDSAHSNKNERSVLKEGYSLMNIREVYLNMNVWILSRNQKVENLCHSANKTEEEIEKCMSMCPNLKYFRLRVVHGPSALIWNSFNQSLVIREEYPHLLSRIVYLSAQLINKNRQVLFLDMSLRNYTIVNTTLIDSILTLMPCLTSLRINFSTYVVKNHSIQRISAFQKLLSNSHVKKVMLVGLMFSADSKLAVIDIFATPNHITSLYIHETNSELYVSIFKINKQIREVFLDLNDKENVEILTQYIRDNGHELQLKDVNEIVDN